MPQREPCRARPLSSDAMSEVSGNLQRTAASFDSVVEVTAFATDRTTSPMPALPEGRRLNLGGRSILAIASEFKVVSFDVFDTLLLRLVNEPAMVFELMARRLGVPHLKGLRVEAEEAARSDNRRLHRTQEVALAQIHAKLGLTSLAASDSMRSELAAESAVLRPNPAAVPILSELRRRGIRTIAISDTYLGRDELRSLLEGCGLALDAIYTSADFWQQDLGKYNGRLFGEVCRLEGLEPRDVLHVGDHPRSDVRNAKAAGVPALHLFAPRDATYLDQGTNLHRNYVLNSMRSLEASVLVGSHAIAKAQGEIDRHSPSWSFGYLYGGPLSAAFSIWLARRAAMRSHDRLVLFGRDGYSIDECLTSLGLETPPRTVFPVSRRMAVAALASVDFERCLSFFPEHCSHAEAKRRIGIFGSAELEQAFEDGEFDESACDPRAFLREHRDEVEAASARDADALREALAVACAAAASPVFVDVGWGLTIHSILDRLLERRMPGLYLGRHQFAYDNGDIECFAFDGRLGLSDRERRFFACIELAELAFADHRPSAARYRRHRGTVEPIADPDEALEQTRRAHILEVREGARAFHRTIAGLVPDLAESEFGRAAVEAFLVAVEHPTDFEKATLGAIAHDREIAAASFLSIAEVWPAAGAGAAQARLAAPDASLPAGRLARMIHLLRRFRTVAKDDGLRVAARRSVRRLRERGP